MKTKRQSTTKKITRSDMLQMIKVITPTAGVIVRHKGVEYGVTGVRNLGIQSELETLEGVLLDLRQCTIRKGTL